MITDEYNGAELAKRRCRTCESWKLISDFYRNSRCPGGYETECKECQKARNRINNRNRQDKSGGVLWAWEGMIARCYNPRTFGYERFGGAGIKVHETWLNNREKFFKWAIENGFKPNSNLWICRINFKGDYSPWNCRIEHVNRSQWHRNAKIAWADVREIRTRWRDGESQVSISKALSISPTVIYRVVHEYSWKPSKDPAKAS